jgi:hypothetical protein
VLPIHRFSGSLSLTHYHTIVTPPFTGGLFIGSSALDLLSMGPFVIDHDQKLGAQANVHYSVKRNLWISGAVRYDSSSFEPIRSRCRGKGPGLRRPSALCKPQFEPAARPAPYDHRRGGRI